MSNRSKFESTHTLLQQQPTLPKRYKDKSGISFGPEAAFAYFISSMQTFVCAQQRGMQIRQFFYGANALHPYPVKTKV